jgi:Zn finger protein HypA/HybF involved in hydrogenase expression
MPNTILQEFSENEEQAAIAKLLIVVKLLESVCSASSEVKKLKNHPIHGYTAFLAEHVLGMLITRREIEHLILEAMEYREDFKRSRNVWVKFRTAKVVELMQEVINRNFEITKEALDLVMEGYPHQTIIKDAMQTKKYHHEVREDSKCPSCSNSFKASEIIEFVEIGYRCPRCRQVISI